METNCHAIEKIIPRTSKAPCTLIVTDDNLLLYTDAWEKKCRIYQLNLMNDAEDVLELESFVGGPSDTQQLLYDSNRRLTYLIVGNTLKIFKIEPSDFMAGIPRPKAWIFDANSKLDENNSRQSSVLNDGSLLVPIDLDGFRLINLETKNSIYKNLPKDNGENYSLIFDDKLFCFREGEKHVEVKSLTTGEKDNLCLEEPAPKGEARRVAVGVDGFYFLDHARGLVQIDLEGKTRVQLDIDKIEYEKQMLLSGAEMAAINRNGIFACFNRQANKIIVIQAQQVNA